MSTHANAASAGKTRSETDPSGLQPIRLSTATPQAYVAAITEPVSPALRATADRSLPMKDRLRPLVGGTVTGAATAADFALLRNILRDPADDDTIRNEVANAMRAAKTPELADDLRAVLADEREESRFRSFAAQHLGVLLVDACSTDPTAAGNLRRDLTAMLRDRHIEVVREAMLALCRAGDSNSLAEAERMLADEERPEMHDLCIRIAAEEGWRKLLPRIRMLAGGKDSTVRVAALVALGDLRDDEALELLQAAAVNSDKQIQAAARLALAKLPARAAGQP